MIYWGRDGMVRKVYGKWTGKVNPFGAIPEGENQVFFVNPGWYLSGVVKEGKGYRWGKGSTLWL